jgi:hypothetical protein
MVLAKNRYEEQWRSHTAICTCFFTKVPKTYNREKTISSTNVTGKTGYLHAEN